MQPWSRDLLGRLDEHVLESEALRGNRLGDPHARPLWVYTPPGTGVRAAAVDLPDPGPRPARSTCGATASAFRPNVVELVDALFADEGCPPALVVFVDAWTSYGGSQFLDSPAVGNYHTYLCDEVVPFVDAHYATRADAAHRGITGKSSGGYGAMVTPMLRPDLFGGLATHAGDALFELCYLPDFPDAVRALRDRTTARSTASGRTSARGPRSRSGTDAALMNTFAMAACYSANEDGSIDLPFDTETGQLIDDVWERWLAWDPVRMVDAHADALRGLRAIYIDAGKSDQYYLDLGAEAFRQRARARSASPTSSSSSSTRRTAQSSTATRSRCGTSPNVSREGARGQARRRHRRHERDRRGDEPPLPRGRRARRRARGRRGRSRDAASVPGIEALRCDVADADAVADAFATVDGLLGGIDVLVANAGISIRKPFLEIDAADWQRVLDVNLTGVFHCAQQAARRMVAGDGGVILMTASTNGLTGHAYYADYNASKAGVILLARTMALELAPAVRVNAVCPGYVLTPMQQRRVHAPRCSSR